MRELRGQYWIAKPAVKLLEVCIDTATALTLRLLLKFENHEDN